MTNLDLNSINAQMQQEQRVKAGVQQFVGETSIAIYAELLRKEDMLNIQPPVTYEQHKELKELAKKAYSFAPYLAEAAGLPVKITHEGDKNVESRSQSQD